MQGRLSPQLRDKIAQFNIRQPYVWKLKLSEVDFDELEACVKACISEKGKNALLQEPNALITLIYMAEWYKRRYQSGNKNERLDGLDLETLWNNAGLSSKAYLYRDANGNRRWEYSIYVLGGLAIQHELGKNDQMKFLKGLCRLYHGEEYTLENLDDQSRAVAFRESIKRQHSIYNYLKEILNGNLPFCEEDLANSNSDINRFVATIKAANDEILKVKFHFEWQVTFNPNYTCMTRRLNVWLKPEEVGGSLHQYLRYDRVHLWGVPNPEKQHTLLIYIRFKNGEESVEPSTMEKPLITYLNTGEAETGFVAFCIERCAQIKHIPTSKFTGIEVVAKDEAGNEYIAQRLETREFLQLWRANGYGDLWTSTQNAQKETALLFSNRCKLKDESASDCVTRQCFRDQQYGITPLWNWFYIYDSVTFTDEHGKEQSLYNRIGYDQITTKLYANTIRYYSGGKVRYYHIDDPDLSDEPDVDEYPLIFGWEDVIVRHFATKDDILNAQPEEECTAELMEWKQENGRYTEWTSLDEPPYGVVQLRITLKGKPFFYRVMYLPGLENEQPIVRNYSQTAVRYKDLNKTECFIQDAIPMDGKVLEPTLTLKYGEGNTYAEVEVYRPTLIKEVLFDGRLIQYLNDDKKLMLPYLLKQRVQLNDFSTDGYQAYSCQNLGNIYTEDYLNIQENPSIGEAALNAWLLNKSFAGNLLDPIAPKSLVVRFGDPEKENDWTGCKALFWNYEKESDPVVADIHHNPEFGIIFQDITANTDLRCNIPRRFDDDPWAWGSVDDSKSKCFEVANQAGTYFFLMKPLRDMKKKDVVEQIYEPWQKLRNGEPTKDDKQGLLRFAEEMGFCWQDYHIFIDND